MLAEAVPGSGHNHNHNHNHNHEYEYERLGAENYSSTVESCTDPGDIVINLA